MFKFTGTIKVIQDTQRISDKFQKREFVVTDTTSMYPQDILFQATQDKCTLLDSFQANDNVEVSFNLRGREWTSPQGEVKFFNTIEAWRIEKQGQSQPMGMPSSGPSAMDMGSDSLPGVGASTEDDDDLPF
ncbi:MAG: DUF3127 domain-containing protein [Flavobacteriales bacterium]|jgi:hypothetical protein